MNPVVVLAGDGASSRILVNALQERFPLERVIIEDAESRVLFLKRRIKRMGVLPVADQVLFQLYGRIAGRGARRRIEEIKAQYGMDDAPPPEALVTRVPSANADETIELLRSLQPKVVVVNGTRILSRRLLESVPAIFLNTHAGITPGYRGVHGGYWALAQGEPDRCGVTVHVVDPGIDTGEVVTQAMISPTPRDSFWTYPYLQLAAGLPLMMQAVEDALAGRLGRKKGEGPSRLWSHPGLTGYLSRRLLKQIR
ncbi:MAG TPA: formyl transferase [Caulobacteraceae bacterium]|nr:formyl transferase [Caulobacteraceae bacterium]